MCSVLTLARRAALFRILTSRTVSNTLKHHQCDTQRRLRFASVYMPCLAMARTRYRCPRLEDTQSVILLPQFRGKLQAPSSRIVAIMCNPRSNLSERRLLVLMLKCRRNAIIGFWSNISSYYCTRQSYYRGITSNAPPSKEQLTVLVCHSYVMPH